MLEDDLVTALGVMLSERRVSRGGTEAIYEEKVYAMFLTELYYLFVQVHSYCYKLVTIRIWNLICKWNIAFLRFHIILMTFHIAARSWLCTVDNAINVPDQDRFQSSVIIP